MNDIHYVDRGSKQVQAEKIYGRWGLSLLYGYSLPARIFAFIFLPLLARMSVFSSLYGYLQRSDGSKRKIVPFAKAFNIDVNELAEPLESFRTFNDFFIRKIKPEARPIVEQPDRVTMPVDGRYLVIPDISKADGFYVKGQHFHLDAFLQDAELAQQYRNGSMVIARLSPMDYHRFHFPVDGTPGAARAIDGPLFSVNPLALAKRFWILSENKRTVTEIYTSFGKVLMVEIGATCVGSIHQTYTPGLPDKKGDEKGYFSFGGSCVVLIFEKGRIVFDQDLIDHSARQLETRCHYGMSLGRVHAS